MSEDAPRAIAAPLEEPREPAETTIARRITALMNGASSLVLAVATCAVLLAAAPTILRTVFPKGQRVSVSTDADHLLPQRRGDDRAHPRKTYGYGAQGRDRASPSLDDPFAPGSPGDDDRAPAWALDPERERTVDEAPQEPEKDREGRARTTRMGLARSALTLHAEPGDDAYVIGEIKAGEQVVIIKEAGLWALVFQSGNMGWTRKSEIAVR
jgi:uncharacterized protein YgiM (DUF1202 family)